MRPGTQVEVLGDPFQSHTGFGAQPSGDDHLARLPFAPRRPRCAAAAPFAQFFFQYPLRLILGRLPQNQLVLAPQGLTPKSGLEPAPGVRNWVHPKPGKGVARVS